MDFGSVISAYLRQLGCTAKALADASGVSAIQLSRWRSGTRRPSAEMLARLADGIALLSGGDVERKEALDAMSAALPPTETWWTPPDWINAPLVLPPLVTRSVPKIWPPEKLAALYV